MAAYLAMRIIAEKMDYSIVYTKVFGQFKDDVDAILIAENKANLIKEKPEN